MMVTVSLRLVGCVVTCGLAEQSAAIVISGVGRIEQEMRHVRKMMEATMAKVKSVHGEVESRVATLAVVADVSVARAAEEILSRVKEVVEYSDAQASRASLRMQPSDWNRE